jgi:hypothetical protein
LKTERLRVEVKTLLHVFDPDARSDCVVSSCFHDVVLLLMVLRGEQWLTTVPHSGKAA